MNTAAVKAVNPLKFGAVLIAAQSIPIALIVDPKARGSSQLR